MLRASVSNSHLPAVLECMETAGLDRSLPAGPVKHRRIYRHESEACWPSLVSLNTVWHDAGSKRVGVVASERLMLRGFPHPAESVQLDACNSVISLVINRSGAAGTVRKRVVYSQGWSRNIRALRLRRRCLRSHPYFPRFWPRGQAWALFIREMLFSMPNLELSAARSRLLGRAHRLTRKLIHVDEVKPHARKPSVQPGPL